MASDLQTTDPLARLAQTVAQSLQDQHDWTELNVHDVGADRPLIRGLPPQCLYIHPDDQIAALEHQHKTGIRLHQAPECEWVLPVRLAEERTIRQFAKVFDSIQANGHREKRVVLAIAHSDSTISYYLMHEGMVKPRQN